MAEVTMPKMGDAMEEGTLLRWLKKEGERVEEQESIAEIETEKASIEIPAFESGVLAQILIPEGQTVSVGTPIALIQGEGEPAPAAREPAPASATETAPPASSPPRAGPAAASPESTEPGFATPRRETRNRAPREEPSAPPSRVSDESREEDGRVKASPLARKIAAEREIDLRQVRGTGPGGRIVEADLEAIPAARPERTRPEAASRPAPPSEPAPAPVAAPPPAVAAEERELSSMRRTIARRLLESKQTIPHYYVTSEIDMRAAADWRDQVNAAEPERPKLSPNDLVIRACALALRKFPAVNSQWVDGKQRFPHEIAVGVAVALPEGLIVPVIRAADQKSVSQISAEVRDLAERARKGELKPNEFSGGTFTVSNLGMYDVESFAAIINPPEAAILAVGTIAEAPVVQNGRLAVGLRMKVTLSADHRIVDGAVAAQFLQEVKRLLQSPMLLV
jgi:pyruvate dehydrogenase E2 component (dihydrolipoamide acetyltransferase)